MSPPTTRALQLPAECKRLEKQVGAGNRVQVNRKHVCITPAAAHTSQIPWATKEQLNIIYASITATCMGTVSCRLPRAAVELAFDVEADDTVRTRRDRLCCLAKLASDLEH
uniref:Uncharacterized protein n=1 Tax=Coccolithus braarudii TaxID=221442 RepID=A0A7S0LQU3_9EUKA